MTRITLTLNDSEAVALIKLARRELRYPRDQAVYLLRQSLIAQGALRDDLADSARPVGEQIAQEVRHEQPALV